MKKFIFLIIFASSFLRIFGDKIFVFGKLQCCERIVSKSKFKNFIDRRERSLLSTDTTYYENDYKRLKSRHHKNEGVAVGCYTPRNVTIQLWEEDGFWPFDNHDLLAEDAIKTDGNFELNGFEEEFMFEDYFLLAYTTCGLSFTQIENGCKRVSKYVILRNWDHIFSYYEKHEINWNIFEKKLAEDVMTCRNFG